jgi:hypothetical protein
MHSPRTVSSRLRAAFLSFTAASVLSPYLKAGSFTQNFESIADNAPLGTAINTHVNLVGANDAAGRVIASKKETNGGRVTIYLAIKSKKPQPRQITTTAQLVPNARADKRTPR